LARRNFNEGGFPSFPLPAIFRAHGEKKATSQRKVDCLSFAAMADAPVPDLESLVQENAALKAKLADYKGLEEDLMAKRVFDKARGYLTTWITLGGIILTLAGFVGYHTVVSYFTNLAEKKA
jgi:hypothetical protein